MQSTFLHIADVHLGIKLKSRGFSLSECKKRRLEIWNTFDNIIKTVKEQKIKYLLIAGDLIDEQYCNFEDVKRIVSQFKAIEDTRILITGGNTDSYSDSCIYNYVNWPKNVYLFKNTTEIESITFEDDNICIYSISRGENNPSNIIQQVNDIEVDDNKINILLMHADIDNADTKKICLKSFDIKQKFDYIALGHAHNYKRIAQNIYYPGTPEPFDYDENDESSIHGVIRGEITKGFVEINFLPLAARKLVKFSINVQKDYDYNKVLDLIKEVGNNINIMADYVKIELCGRINSQIAIDELKEEARQFFYDIDFEDDYTFEKNVTESMGKLKGNIIENYIIQFKKEDNNDKLYEKAFELGLQVLKTEGGVK